MKKKNEKGIALLLTVLLLGVVFTLVLYFLSLSLTEFKIAANQSWGTKSYYLAEAGVNEMIWLIENDDVYKNNFQTNKDWTATFERDNPFGGGGYYSVSIANQGRADAVITATGEYGVGLAKPSQTSLQLAVKKDIEIESFASTTEGASYSRGYTDIVNSNVDFNAGIYSNGNFLIIGSQGEVNIYGDVNVAGNFNYSGAANVYIEGVVNNPTEEVEIARIDFDSEDENSFKNQADHIYTQAQFAALLAASNNIVLNYITYVEGSVIVPRGKTLTINGALVMDGIFEVETCNSKCKEEDRSIITVNRIGDNPSGIMAKGNIIIRHNFIDFNSNGIVYSDDKITISDLKPSSVFNVNGAFIADEINFDNVDGTINLYRDGDVINNNFGSGTYSPLIMEYFKEVHD